MTRELDLNNPMGLKQSNDKFQGETHPSSDSVFKEFVTMVEGVRAGAKVLLTYFGTHNLTTVRGIITRWAPGIENDTASYISDVCGRMHVTPDEDLDLTIPDVLEDLVAAIVHHENGVSLDEVLLSQGVLLAL